MLPKKPVAALPRAFSRLFIAANLLALILAFAPTPAFALPTTSVTVNASVTTAPVGSSVTLTATVTSGAGTPDGTVLFVADLLQIGTTTLNGSGQAIIATSGLSVGVHSIVVLYLGSLNFAPSTSIGLSINITLAVCTINVNASLSTVALGASVTLTATVSGSNGTPTGTITFKAGASVLGNFGLNGGGQGSLAVTTSLIGALLIEVDYGGDPNYLTCISPIVTITVTAGPSGNSTGTTLSSSLNPAPYGQAVVFTASVTSSSGTPAGTVTFMDAGRTIGTSQLSAGAASLTMSSLIVGYHTITAAYGGNGSFSASVSSPLQQSIAVPPDSMKLREVQVVVTRVAAQISGDAIAGTIEAAVEEGLSGSDDRFVTPSALGLRMNSAGYGDRNSKLPPPDWIAWADLRQTSMNPGGGSSSGLSGSQVNSFAGLTLRVTSNFVVGAFGGYEVFGYDVTTLSGRLRGDGVTGGAYIGWRFLPGLRFEAGLSRSAIG